jgi:hypothetical protein
VIHRELTANRDAFTELQHAVATELEDDGLSLLRLHDLLLWLSATLRLTHAVELGRTSP